jgi:hypothetical protein
MLHIPAERRNEGIPCFTCTDRSKTKIGGPCCNRFALLETLPDDFKGKRILKKFNEGL